MVMTFVIRWSWLLGLALFLPVSLPAGGEERFLPQVCRFVDSIPLLAGDCCNLRAEPSALAPSLRTIEVGTPLRVLRTWHSSNGQEWLQVQISTNEIIELSSVVRRGWVNV